MPDPNKIIYVDVETTGLNPRWDSVWEIGYAVGDGTVQSSVVPHTLRISKLTAEALAVNGYATRWPQEMATFPTPESFQAWAGEFEAEMHRLLVGATVVGANPAFDTAMLAARWSDTPWHYRLLDVETYAMPALGLDRPIGLARLCEALGVAAPDHTAAGDVTAVRACHQTLVDHYASASQHYDLAVPA